MNQVTVVSTDQRLEEALRVTGLKIGRLDPSTMNALIQSANPPAVLVVDVRGQQELPQFVGAFRRQHPGTGLVLVASASDPALMLQAMRAGVTEYVHEPLTAEVLEQSVRRVIVGGFAPTSGQVVAFVGAKGGVGTTTLAVNTGTALAMIADGDVLLMDLHIGSGDAALFLGVEPRFSVVDALENVGRLDEALFRSVIEKTTSGLDVLASSDRMVAGIADARHLRALLDFVASRYRYIVLDVPRSDVTMLDALPEASVVTVVTNQELPSLRSAGRLAHNLRARYGSARVRTVMNRFDRRAEIAHADVERVIGSSVKHLIPSDYRVAVEALNEGRPVVLEKSSLADSLRVLAADLGGVRKEEGDRHAGVFSRLAFRRA